MLSVVMPNVIVLNVVAPALRDACFRICISLSRLAQMSSVVNLIKLFSFITDCEA
jgi:hypothetical protein